MIHKIKFVTGVKVTLQNLGLPLLLHCYARSSSLPPCVRTGGDTRDELTSAADQRAQNVEEYGGVGEQRGGTVRGVDKEKLGSKQMEGWVRRDRG